MPKRGEWTIGLIFLYATVLVLGCGSLSAQSEYKVLYNFDTAPNDGLFGIGNLVADAAGNLYGLTQGGGTMNGGTIFELSPNSDGSWSETILYNFCDFYQNSCPSGGGATGLTIDSKGNLYGDTCCGGANGGGGVVFELSPSTGGVWTYTVLYNFCTIQEGYCEDGNSASGQVALDASGNIYGTAEGGGKNGKGVVFELSAQSNGWTETILYNFCSVGGSDCLDGAEPQTGVTLDKSGKLYGTTHAGGSANSCAAGGVVFGLSPGVDGWTEQVLGVFPEVNCVYYSDPGPVSIDPAGNLYTTFTFYEIIHEGVYSNGAVIELSRNGKQRVFRFDGVDGSGPLSGVTIDVHRMVVYGTTAGGFEGPGNVFQIDSSGAETVLYNFQSGDPAQGYLPAGGVLEDRSGNLYGTTLYGGSGGDGGAGVVYEVIP
jgi:uncharacterized repeat protein (TIGR03803 family)